MPKRGHDANRGLETFLQPIDRIVCGSDEGSHNFIIFENPHQSSVADRRQIALLHVFRSKKIYLSAVLKYGIHSHVGVSAVSGNTFYRLSHKGYIQTVGAEDILYYIADMQLVVG